MINIPHPELQIDFAAALGKMRALYLQDSLSATVGTLDIVSLDQELAHYVPRDSLALLAQHGLRGELMFAVPLILKTNPYLIGYYRLLYGYSQKQFYTAQTGLSSFAVMENKGSITAPILAMLPDLCHSLAEAGSLLLNGIGSAHLSRSLIDDLTLLTLGPQLRGGANVKKGTAGIVKVFDLIQTIVQHAVIDSQPNRIEIANAAGRMVLIEFAADPDIIIREEMVSGSHRLLIAIEVKSGSDFSNIHNRIGEAEKSHQKARAAGYVECWTVVNVDRIDLAMARRESPSTNRFYRISDLVDQQGTEYLDFRDRIISLTGIRI